jgi:Holliday junction resolvase RusA-like endonuclease
MKKDIITINFLGKVLSKDNCKITNRAGYQFLPQEYKDFETSVGWDAKIAMKGKALLQGRLAVALFLFWEDNHVRDIGNYQKSVMDSLTGIVYQDDGQIDYLLIGRAKKETGFVVDVGENFQEVLKAYIERKAQYEIEGTFWDKGIQKAYKKARR